MTDYVTIPFLEAPSYIKPSNSYYALHHYKKPIPYLLKSGCTVEINTNHACSICVYNNNRLTEQVIFNVMGDERIQITQDSVVFINNILTNNKDETYRVTYSIEGEFEPLTHVIMGDNDYRDGVDESSSFVFVEGTWIQLLVPQVDLEHLNGLIEEDIELNQLNDFYTNILNFYNDLTSTVFQRKYFAKADIGGGGGAFYGRYTMGQTSNSMRAFFLTPSHFNWGCLHEIAHSFDAYFVNDLTQISLQEVWTNLFPDYYQYIHLSQDEYLNQGWTFEGKRNEILAKLKLQFGNVSIQNWDFREKLIFLKSFFYKVGHKKLFTDLFNMMRNKLNEGVFNEYTFKTMNLIMYLFNEYGMDVVHVNQLIGVENIDKILEQNIKYNQENSVYVFDFMMQSDVVDFVLTNSNFNIQQDVNLQFKNVHPPDLIGGHYTLIQNMDNIKRSTFTNDTHQLLTSLNGGCYKFFYNTGNSTQRYYCDNGYVLFDGLSLTPTLNIVPHTHSSMLNENFYFYGLGDLLAASLEINYLENTIHFDVKRNAPHLYFEDLYFSVNIENLAIFEFVGTHNDIDQSVYKFPIKMGQKIIIYHREINRLISAFNTIDNTNTFTITNQGIQHNNNNVTSQLINKIVNYCQLVSLEYPLLIESAYVQNEVYLAVVLLSQSQQNNLYPVIENFLPDTTVTAITAMDFRNRNLLRVNEQDGFLRIVTFNNREPNVNVAFQLLRNNKPIYSLHVAFDDWIFDTQEYYELRQNDIIYLEMNDIENKRFIVIDGELRQPPALRVCYRWDRDTFRDMNCQPNCQPINTIIQLLVIIGVIFIIFLLIFIICRLMSSSEKQTTASVPTHANRSLIPITPIPVYTNPPMTAVK
jgi:hypothetical protein